MPRRINPRTILSSNHKENPSSNIEEKSRQNTQDKSFNIKDAVKFYFHQAKSLVANFLWHEEEEEKKHWQHSVLSPIYGGNGFAGLNRGRVRSYLSIHGALEVYGNTSNAKKTNSLDIEIDFVKKLTKEAKKKRDRGQFKGALEKIDAAKYLSNEVVNNSQVKELEKIKKSIKKRKENEGREQSFYWRSRTGSVSGFSRGR